MARGMMARYIILQSPKNLTELKKFNTGGYRYNKELSDEKTLMFTR
ncbi:MAG: peroxide stress protein YaaA [Flavobacteriales bacterium]